MSGKGSAPRPYSVKDDVFAENYCNTFGHKEMRGRCMNCGQPMEQHATDGDLPACKEQGGNNGVQEGTIR